ncbi:hypothetical protein [Methyloterricola oryzae]|uniref:hypothetical protein n=1 Tax=Methyloterricola oryzae TaxID=1495050 RepID=UPI001300F1B2|nr:hypothetical protein [Methyloterricola oryzae]
MRSLLNRYGKNMPHDSPQALESRPMAAARKASGAPANGLNGPSEDLEDDYGEDGKFIV